LILGSKKGKEIDPGSAIRRSGKKTGFCAIAEEKEKSSPIFTFKERGKGGKNSQRHTIPAAAHTQKKGKRKGKGIPCRWHRPWQKRGGSNPQANTLLLKKITREGKRGEGRDLFLFVKGGERDYSHT